MHNLIGGEIQIMKNLYFDDFEDLAYDIAGKFDELNKEEFEDISVIAKPDEVKEIFKELVCIGYDICNITYERIDWDGYDDEYILSMNHEGIWIEKFKRENGYYEDESTITYILDNCSSKVIPYCKGKVVYEVSVGDDEDGNDCSECACKKDEKPTTSTTSKSATYKINNKEVSKEEFDKKYEEFEEMYLNNIRDMLLNYCNFMDEVNDWKSRLFRW